jgi:hypothetical protein
MKRRKIIGTFIFNPDIVPFYTIGAVQCQKTCTDAKLCFYWNFDTGSNQWELLSSIEKYDDSFDDWVCGTKRCMHVIIEDREDNTIEDQYKTYSQIETVFEQQNVQDQTQFRFENKFYIDLQSYYPLYLQ